MLNGIDLSRADLNLLVLFEVVLEERHVGRAATRMNLTASAVSHGLGRLRRLFDDPLFLRAPKGVVPTDRAVELAQPVADILARTRHVLAAAAPFDAATSTRRFTVGAPDGISVVLLGRLLARLRREAPGVDLALCQVLPRRRMRTFEAAWAAVLDSLESRAFDVAVLPLEEPPPRFHARLLYLEDFVTVARADHPYLAAPSLDRFCGERHMVVSQGGDPHGFVDETLAGLGRSRRVALTVPNFMMAMAVLAETDLVAALPRRTAEAYGARFSLACTDLPFPVTPSVAHAIVPKAALLDHGLAWFLDALCDSDRGGGTPIGLVEPDGLEPTTSCLQSMMHMSACVRLCTPHLDN
jgi:DNA-binding transcriptional LysR family regulator